MTRNKYDDNRLAEYPEIKAYFDDIDYRLAERAYQHTSQFPERASSLIRCDYAQQLLTDLKTVQDSILHAEKQGATVNRTQDDIDHWFASHRQGLKEKYEAYLHSHSQVASAFICGPAKFPVARNQKRSQWADNKYLEIDEFRQKSIKRFLRDVLPYGDGSAIRTDDPNATQKILSKVEKLEQQRDHMKLINKTIRKFYKARDPLDKDASRYRDCIAALVALNVQEHAAQALLEPKCGGQIVGVEPWQLSHLGAEIRRLKQRKKEVTTVESLVINDSFPQVERVSISDDQKIVIEFGYKPNENTRRVLKSNGFKWSRYREAWVRKLTINAYWAYQNTIRPMLKAL